MASSTVTSKGQITIPVEVRTKLGLHPGSRIAFVPTADGGYEIHPEAGSIRDFRGVVAAPAVPVGLDEMDAAIGAEASLAPR